MSLGEQLGQSVIVENVSGAGGTIGTARAAHAAPDGYTLLVGTPSTHGSNVAVYSNLDYDPVRDFAPVMLIGTSPFMLLAAPSFEAKSVKDLVALAKAKPGHHQLRVLWHWQHQSSCRRALRLARRYRRHARALSRQRTGHY